jgi:hypothetical protein
MRRTIVLTALGLSLALANHAGAVTCHTYQDVEWQRWVTECSDGSRAVTRYDEQVKQWRTEVTKPGAASQAAEEPYQH